MATGINAPQPNYLVVLFWSEASQWLMPAEQIGYVRWLLLNTVIFVQT